MLTENLKRLIKRHPGLAICRFCKKPVDPESEDSEYIKSRVNEEFFHRSCFVREYKESIKK